MDYNKRFNICVTGVLEKKGEVEKVMASKVFNLAKQKKETKRSEVVRRAASGMRFWMERLQQVLP